MSAQFVSSNEHRSPGDSTRPRARRPSSQTLPVSPVRPSVAPLVARFAARLPGLFAAPDSIDTPVRSLPSDSQDPSYHTVSQRGGQCTVLPPVPFAARLRFRLAADSPV